MALRRSSSLHSNPYDRKPVDLPELPVNTVVDTLMAEEGPGLDLVTRTNPKMIRAAQTNYIYATVLGSDYCRRRFELIERLSISLDAGGRHDLIESLKAGGTVPDAYYTGGAKRGETEYDYIRTEQ